MGRVFWRSLREPLGSPGSAVSLAAVALLVWLLSALQLLMIVERAEQLPWVIGFLANLLSVFIYVPAVILALPILSGEARDRSLLLHLMLPFGRAEYYTGRVLGRALFGLLYFLVTVAGAAALVLVYAHFAFEAAPNPFPPDVLTPLLLKGLTLVTVVMALAALAPISSSRFGHVFYWAGFCVIVSQAHGLLQAPGHSGVTRALARFAVEGLGPALLGPAPQFVEEAALSDWHLGRALLQWAFGVAVAYVVGVFAFSRMEVGLRS